MLYNQIVNPKTGRKVNINGRIGRKILSNYINYLNGGASNCANFHSDPIKCQSSRDESGNYCVYSAAKYRGEVGQCRKSSAKDVEKSKESARRRKTLEKKFQESAALRLQKRYRSKKRVDRFADAAGDMFSKEQTRKSQEKAAKIAEEIRIANLKELAKKVPKKKKCKLNKRGIDKNLTLDCGSCSYRYDAVMEEDGCLSDATDVINDPQCATYCELDNMVQEEPPKLIRRVAVKELADCKTLKKGKCRETKGCMLTKGKKKNCVPCDLKKYNTKDQCLYR